MDAEPQRDPRAMLIPRDRGVSRTHVRPQLRDRVGPRGDELSAEVDESSPLLLPWVVPWVAVSVVPEPLSWPSSQPANRAAAQRNGRGW